MKTKLRRTLSSRGQDRPKRPPLDKLLVGEASVRFDVLKRSKRLLEERPQIQHIITRCRPNEMYRAASRQALDRLA